MWALRLARGMRGRGHTVALVVHPPRGPEIPETDYEGCQVHRIGCSEPLEHCAGDYAAYLPTYRRAFEQLEREAGAPVVTMPNLDAECHGLMAALSQEYPGLLRVASWTHNDIAHDYRVAEHYEVLCGAFIGVSRHITQTLSNMLPGRAGDVLRIPYGVECGPPPAGRRKAAGPIRLIYTGRIDHFQKRVMALPAMSRALTARGVAHTLTIVGDGPASTELDAAIASQPHMRRLTAGRRTLNTLLREHDVFVLPSRFEGLSISMLEAMAAGCVPVVTNVASGASEAIAPGGNGELVDPVEDDALMGEMMAAGVERALKSGIDRLSAAAYSTVKERFSIESHLTSVQSMIARLAGDHARDWPSARPPSAARADGLGFSVPSGAADAAARALAQLAGRRVALWGAGRHSASVLSALRDEARNVVAVLDDDSSRRGKLLQGRPVISLNQAPGFGVTDVLISSALHEKEMWERRGPLEAAGVRVHRMYGPGQSPLAA